MRRAWVMKLKPGSEGLYKQRHDELWPEMRAVMETGDVVSFSIYRYGLLLFAYQELREEAREVAGAPPIVWRWWESMAPLMETNPDLSPIQEPLEEMFHFQSVSQ